jgi:GMP synthase (glutamine-hydrolysing)
MHELILILDFGSQYTQLIARRIRELDVYCEIYPYNLHLREIKKKNPKGIILSGGPSSVYEKGAPSVEKEIFELGIPILGICYGQQLMAHFLGGEVESAERREYGKATIVIDRTEDLFNGVRNNSTVWMSHGDRVKILPDGFEIIGHTDNSPFAAMRDKNKKIYGIQFHPEVIHTEDGKKILQNFLFNIAQCKGDWTPKSFVDETIKKIKENVGNGRVICALSGGVDSSVTSLLLYRAIGKNFICIFVDNGFLRKNEKEQVINTFILYFGKILIKK